MQIPFAQSPRSTVGIEWELALVDAESADLSQVAPQVFAAIQPGGGDHPLIRREFLQNTIEVVSGPHARVAEAGADLARGIEIVRGVLDPLGVELMCAGTHPFARARDQAITDKARYATLIQRTAWWGQNMLIYGVHTHVGIEDQAKVLPIMRALMCYIPHLQALSAASPFWAGEDTGYASNRSMMFQQLPTAGLPYQFETWAELEHYLGDLIRTGVVEEFNEVRWDIRPSPQFGTIEVRVCDGLPTMAEVLGVSALVQCLVEELSGMLDRGQALPMMPTWLVQENKWRTARYGMDAIVIVDDTCREQPFAQVLPELLARLEPIAEQLGCREELGALAMLADVGASYQRQRRVARTHDGDLSAVVAALVREMRAGQPLG